MRKTMLCLAALMAFSTPAFAQSTVVGYSFEGAAGPSLSPTFTNPVLVNTVSDMSNNGGVAATVANGQASLLPFFPNSQGNSYRITNFVTVPNTGFHFSFNVNAPFTLSITNYSFDATTDGSTGAPTDWDLRINGISVATGVTQNNTFTAVGSIPIYAGAIDLSGLSGLVNVDLIATGAGSTQGTWRIDNFELSAVPEPSTYALIGITGICVAGGVYYQRRKHGKMYGRKATA